MKKMKLFCGILILLMVFSSCSDDNSDEQENLCGIESRVKISPPNWIQGTWVDPNDNEEGFRFTGDDIILLNDNDQSSLIDSYLDPEFRGNSPYIMEEVIETDDTYEVNIQLYDDETCEEVFTNPIWKWTKVDDNTIRYYGVGTYDYIKL
tara:strand:- start:899 stop:1348 length:450 start_codon:yes stop_codon:yes gene_type:complete